MRWFLFCPVKNFSSNELNTDTLLSRLSAQLISHDTAVTGLLHRESSHCGSTVSCQHAKTDSMVQTVYMKQSAKPRHLWHPSNDMGRLQPSAFRFKDQTFDLGRPSRPTDGVLGGRVKKVAPRLPPAGQETSQRATFL